MISGFMKQQYLLFYTLSSVYFLLGDAKYKEGWKKKKILTNKGGSTPKKLISFISPNKVDGSLELRPKKPDSLQIESAQTNHLGVRKCPIHAQILLV